jgi:hypothetical protein
MDGLTTFQIISIILVTLSLVGTIVGVYVKTLLEIQKVDANCKIELAKIEVEIVSMRRDLMAKEIAICKLEETNRADHKEILDKINKIIEKIYV